MIAGQQCHVILWDYTIMNSWDDNQEYSSVGFTVHQSESLHYWSIIWSVWWAAENKVSAQLDFQKTGQRLSVLLCRSLKMRGREPQQGEKSFCVKAAFVSRIVACFSQFLTQGSQRGKPGWLKDYTLWYRGMLACLLWTHFQNGRDRYTAPLTLKLQGVDVSAQLEMFRHHNWQGRCLCFLSVPFLPYYCFCSKWFSGRFTVTNFSCCDWNVHLPTGKYTDSQRLLTKPQHFMKLLFYIRSASRHSKLTRLWIQWRRWRRGL